LRAVAIAGPCAILSVGLGLRVGLAAIRIGLRSELVGSAVGLLRMGLIRLRARFELLGAGFRHAVIGLLARHGRMREAVAAGIAIAGIAVHGTLLVAAVEGAFAAGEGIAAVQAGFSMIEALARLLTRMPLPGMNGDCLVMVAVAAAAGHRGSAAEGARAAVREAPIVDGVAVAEVVRMVEEDGIRQPVETPCQQAEGSVFKSCDAKAKAVMQTDAEEGSERAEQREPRIGRDGCAVDGPRIVGRDINDFRIGRGESDVALVLRDLFLGRVLEVSGLLGALAETLHGAQDVLRLVVIRVAERGGPLQIAVEHLQDLRERREGFYAGIP